MKDTFFHWDYIFVEKISYRFSEPKFLDVVIFTPPVPRTHQLTWFRCLVEHLNEMSLNHQVCNYSDKYIKRVIWVPWDFIKIENWAVYRNWEILEESSYLNVNNNWKTYLPSFQTTSEFTVPEESIFVLWDNRNWSSDSRYWKSENWENKSFVPYKDLTWKFILRLFSPNKIFWENK
jgi:signal peptidase I